MGIDLQYLLFLQNLRLATGGIFDEFFNGMSKVAVDVLPFLPFLIFLCVNKKWGYRFLYSYLGANLLNGAVKLTVCAYRPWIRSNLIEPAGDSKVAATGYSFPSGHSVSASSLYGSVVENQWSKRRWLAIFCTICILLTGFSRNFLGVHTPQDVIVGLTEGMWNGITFTTRFPGAMSISRSSPASPSHCSSFGRRTLKRPWSSPFWADTGAISFPASSCTLSRSH